MQKSKAQIILIYSFSALLLLIAGYFIGYYTYKFLNQPSETPGSVEKSSLHIKQLSIGLGSEIVVGPSDKNISFLKFEAQAKNGDVLLNRIRFMDGNGNPYTKNYGNLSLWVDTDGDGNTDTRVQQQVLDDKNVAGTRFIIDKIGGEGYLIPSGQKIIFELKADGETLMKNKEGIIMLFSCQNEESCIAATNANTKEALKGIETIRKGLGNITDTYCEDTEEGGYNCDILLTTSSHLEIVPVSSFN